MASGQPSKRLHRARSELTHRRTSMDSMKTDFRNKFLDRLRNTRSKSVDRFRRIVESYDHDVEYRSLSELRHVLLVDQEATALINTDEVSELLHQVETELRQVSLEYEAESHAKETKNETEDAVKRLMGVCQMCHKMSVDNVCANCTDQINYEFK